MLDQILGTLRKLRDSFSRKAEQAYENRDAAEADSAAKAYAEGEGHAYAIAEEEVRDAERHKQEQPGD